MNRTKYRIWLISIVLAAVAFGVFYFIRCGSSDKPAPQGTLVWQTEDGKKGSCPS